MVRIHVNFLFLGLFRGQDALLRRENPFTIVINTLNCSVITMLRLPRRADIFKNWLWSAFGFHEPYTALWRR